MTTAIGDAYTSSPLRNRLAVELDAAVSDVWALVGDLGRFPEYSYGLEEVEVIDGPDGSAAEYVCHFKPVTEGGAPLLHREILSWYEPPRGWASMSEEPNAFGLSSCLTLVTLEPSSGGTTLTWDEYFQAEDLDLNKGIFADALVDIGEKLVGRFGGRLLERYVEG